MLHEDRVHEPDHDTPPLHILCVLPLGDREGCHPGLASVRQVQAGGSVRPLGNKEGVCTLGSVQVLHHWVFRPPTPLNWWCDTWIECGHNQTFLKAPIKNKNNHEHIFNGLISRTPFFLLNYMETGLFGVLYIKSLVYMYNKIYTIILSNTDSSIASPFWRFRHFISLSRYFRLWKVMPQIREPVSNKFN